MSRPVPQNVIEIKGGTLIFPHTVRGSFSPNCVESQFVASVLAARGRYPVRDAGVLVVAARAPYITHIHNEGGVLAKASPALHHWPVEWQTVPRPARILHGIARHRPVLFRSPPKETLRDEKYTDELTDA
jgi:hypothetical protein